MPSKTLSTQQGLLYVCVSTVILVISLFVLIIALFIYSNNKTHNDCSLGKHLFFSLESQWFQETRQMFHLQVVIKCILCFGFYIGEGEMRN